MEVIKAPIEGLFVIKPKVFFDSRGYFFESYSKRDFESNIGFGVDFVQDNQSKSTRGVIRGMHFQKGEYAQAKLVRCIQGRVLDVALDLRKGSPTYGRHFSIELSDENNCEFFIPRGFAHGFAVLSDEAVFQYKCDNYYKPDQEGGISPIDPSLAIDWKINLEEAILSDKDLSLPLFYELNYEF